MKTKSVLLAFCLFTTSFGCQSAQAPDHLLGVWKTAAPHYAGRFLAFTKETIIFAPKGDSTIGYPIVKITQVREDSRILYTIFYRDSDRQEYYLSFYYEPTNGGAITFKNQPQLRWTRERS